MTKRDRWILNETDRNSYFSRIKGLWCDILLYSLFVFNIFSGEKERKRRLPITSGMTRLLGEDLKDDSGQGFLFVYYSLSMSSRFYRNRTSSQIMWNHNLRTSQLLSHFSTEFYITRKIEEIYLNFVLNKEKKPRGRRVRKIVILYSNKNKCQNKKKKTRPSHFRYAPCN